MILALALALAATPGEAIVVSLHGEVSVRADGTNQPLTRLQRLPPASVVRTGPGARVSLRLPSGSLLELGENTTLELQALDQIGRASERVERFKLWIGSLWARVTDLAGVASRFELEASGAVAGVRGTTFGAWVSAAGGSFAVESGTVEIHTIGPIRTMRRLDAGMTATFSADGHPRPPPRAAKRHVREVRAQAVGRAGNARDAAASGTSDQARRNRRRRRLLQRPDSTVDSPTANPARPEAPATPPSAILRIQLLGPRNP